MGTMQAVFSALWLGRRGSMEDSSHAGHKAPRLTRTGSLFWGGHQESSGDENSRRSSLFKGSHHGSMHYIEHRNTEAERWWLIYPDNLWYIRWRMIHILLAAYSGFYAPYDFAFLQKRPLALHIWDWFLGVLFIGDVILHFFVVYIDRKTYRSIDDPKKIALRYLQTWFVVDLLAAIPFDIFVGGDTNSEVFRWLTLTTLGRLRHFNDLFSMLERDVTISYIAVRMVRLLVVVLFTAHLSACMFYYLAVTIHTADQDNTWIGLIYTNPPGFRTKSNSDRYLISLYWAVVTLATVGYGDFHAVSIREMVWSIIYMLFNMVLMTYVLGSMTALIVHAASRTQDFRDRVREVKAFAMRNRLEKPLRRQMAMHEQLKFQTTSLRLDVLDQFPKSIRAKITRSLYSELIKDIYLFRGCSSEFLAQIANEVEVEWFLPEEEIIHNHDASVNFYIVVKGTIDVIEVDHEGRTEKVSSVEKGEMFGEIAMLCNTKQTHTFRSNELVQVLRLSRIVFKDICTAYVQDGHLIVQNLLKRAADDNDVLCQNMSSDITALIQKQEVEHTMNLCYIASRGDLSHLQKLVKGGVSPNRADYDGRTPLHLSATKGYKECVLYLIASGADVNFKDNFGGTPLMEALKNNHLETAREIYERGGRVNLAEAGSDMCVAAMHGNIEILKHYIDFGVDPNACDYDSRTALHVGSSEGFLLVVKTLLERGANPLFPDRWGHTSIDEAHRWNHPKILVELKKAASRQQNGQRGRDGHASASSALPSHSTTPRIAPPPITTSRPTSPRLSAPITDADFFDSLTPIATLSPQNSPRGREAGASASSALPSRPMTPKIAPPPITASRPTSPRLNPTRNDAEFFDSLNTTSSPRQAPRISPRGKKGIVTTDYSNTSRPTAPKPAPPTSDAALFDPLPPEGKVLEEGSVLAHIASGNRIAFSDQPFHLLSGANTTPSTPKRKRVTINRYHPRSTDALTHPGKVVALPSTMDMLLNVAASAFDYKPTRVLNARGAIVEEMILIEDGDILYIVEEHDLKGPQSAGITPTQEHEIKDLLAKLQLVLRAVEQK